MNKIRLSNEEMRFFRDNGFLIKRQILKPDLVERAQEAFWLNAPGRLKRNEPTTWVGPFADEQRVDDGTDYRGGHRWNLRHVGDTPWMMDLIPRDPDIVAMAEQLLGVGKLRAPHITRGIYTTLPRSDEDFEPDHLHVDQHPFHLGVVGYLGDVVPNGGGFRVWPSSHQWFYYVFESQYKSERNEAYDRVRSLFESQPSLECTGGTGDIVFWHHRLAHMAGRNYSRHLRQAVLYDFTRSDLEVAQEEPSQDNMWRDWPGIDALQED